MNRNKEKASSIILLIIIIFILIAGYITYLSLKSNMKENISYENYYQENIASIGNEAKGYFYNQLLEPSKIMYTAILANIESLKDGSGEIKISSEISDSIKEIGNDEENYFQSAWDAISLDNVELFFVDTKNLSLATKKMSILGYKSYEFTIEPQLGKKYYSKSFKNRQEVDNALQEVENVVNDIIANAKGSTYDKVKYAHDWIVDNIEYDNDDSVDKDNIYGAFINKKVVCEGYAEAFKHLLDKLNIPCVLVYGNGFNSKGESEAHAWNYVKMPDDKWYAVDTTWDDPIYVGIGNIIKFNPQKYEHFLKGATDFNKTHILDGDVSGTGQNFKYPELSIDDYKK